MMIRMKNRETQFALLLVGFFLLGHLVFLAAPFVNLESWYANTAHLIFQGNLDGALRCYEQVIANPILAVVAIVPFYALLGSSEFSARIFSLLTGVLTIVLVYWGTARLRSPRVALGAAAIVGVNPIFWTYSGLAYTDVPFTFMITLTMLCAFIAVERDNLPLHIAAAILMGLSALTKYNAIVFVPVIATTVISATLSEQTGWRQAVIQIGKVLSIYALVCIIMVIPYLAWVNTVLGHLLRPAWVDTVGIQLWRSFSMPLTLLRLTSYLIWLGVFTGPLLFFVIIDAHRYLGHHLRTNMPLTLILTLSLIIVNVSLVVWVSSAETTLGSAFGEMELGWLRHVFSGIPLLTTKFVFLTAAEFLTIGLGIWGFRSDRAKGFVIAWVLLVILQHALFRATNRYALFVLPALAIYLSDVTVRSLERTNFRVLKQLVVAGSVMTFVASAIFSSTYFAQQGRAAASVANYINSKRLEGIQYNPWDGVQTHSGYLIDKALFADPHDGHTARYVTTALKRNETAPNIVYAVDVKLLGVVFKRFAILERAGP